MRIMIMLLAVGLTLLGVAEMMDASQQTKIQKSNIVIMQSLLRRVEALEVQLQGQQIIIDRFLFGESDRAEEELPLPANIQAI